MGRLKNLQETVGREIKAAGYTQKEVAGKLGITGAMLSQALSGKAGMREERWRMACEMLGLDFDELMGYKTPVTDEVFALLPEIDETPAEEPAEETVAKNATTTTTEDAEEIEPEWLDNMRILCAYAEGHIIEDIKRGGWTFDLDKLRGLLDAVCDMREALEKGK